ncbi:hypothetical protein MCEJIRE27_00235 [Candidatus Nanopelagicaceae bacterium]
MNSTLFKKILPMVLLLSLLPQANSAFAETSNWKVSTQKSTGEFSADKVETLSQDTYILTFACRSKKTSHFWFVLTSTRGTIQGWPFATQSSITVSTDKLKPFNWPVTVDNYQAQFKDPVKLFSKLIGSKTISFTYLNRADKIETFRTSGLKDVSGMSAYSKAGC